MADETLPQFLSSYETIGELRQLIKDIETEITRRQEERQAAFHAQANQLAAELGMTVKQLMGQPRKRNVTGKTKQKKDEASTQAKPPTQQKTPAKEKPSSEPRVPDVGDGVVQQTASEGVGSHT